MTYVHDLTTRDGLPSEGLEALVGGKAAGLVVMSADLGLPVPPAFAITTQACRAYLAGGWPEGLDEEIAAHLAILGRAVGRHFGDPERPLLLSVRSGAPVSMPGMMDTILDLGLNERTGAGLAAMSGDPGFAADCHRRFTEMFARIVGVATVPDDPRTQLRMAVEAVFRSWNSDRAHAYRRRERIADDLGTAVTVQAMVFGNMDADSATGVLFTRSPATGEATLYGDVLFGSQGEDVVAGAHDTQPLAVLDTRMPGVARELRRNAQALERHFTDLCDIEFTIEHGSVWMLQVRVGKRTPQAALRIAVEMAEDPGFPLSREQAVRRVAALLADPPRVVVPADDAAAQPLAVGLPVSPGVATGVIATSSGAALAAAEAGQAVILVRNETSPEDVQGMSRAAGVLTATGGLASHAAVVARGWGIPGVVGTTALEVLDGGILLAGRTLAAGEVLSIDGGTGEVFAGAVSRRLEAAPEAATLLAWARELGIAINAAPSERDEPAPVAGRAEATEVGLVHALSIKGSAVGEMLAQALMLKDDDAQRLLDGLVAAHHAERAAGAYRLTQGGRHRARELLTADQDRWEHDAATAALDRFQELDRGMKAAVTAWQVRYSDGEQTINDHSDPEYDDAVLSQLAELVEQTAAWLASLTNAPARLATYTARLERALARARDGEERFVASPRVDSCHTVWFDLHEDLIRLAGSTRSAEAAAGRA